jgi:predicted nucleic acid-binding protein
VVVGIILDSDFIKKKSIENTKLCQEIQSSSHLDQGEVEAITLALETDFGLIIDEKAGRKFAKSKGIKIMGLLGVLEINLLMKKIDYVELLYLLDEFKKVGYRLHPKLEKEFLNKVS